MIAGVLRGAAVEFGGAGRSCPVDLPTFGRGGLLLDVDDTNVLLDVMDSEGDRS